MPNLNPSYSLNEPDPALLARLAPVKRICLWAVAIVSVVILVAWLIPLLGLLLPSGWALMTAGTAFAALLGASSLKFAETRRSPRAHRLSQALAIAVGLLGSGILLEYAFLDRGAPPPFYIGRIPSPLFYRMSPQTASAFTLFGIVVFLIGARKRFASAFADLTLFCYCFTVLVLVSGQVFGATRLFGVSNSLLSSPQTLVCLILLAIVATLQRAEHGVFGILLGSGIGSRIARALTPVLLVLPFLREIGRARMTQGQLIPAQYATAILTSLTGALSFALLLVLVWYINGMEAEIRDLTLRDELTGLYNLRGFHLLAEQALRLAQRAGLPFSVLYIDVDNLKQINDALGHDQGSAFLADAGRILKGIFRETDVSGRIGGDEFAVAGQFSQVAVSIAAQRVEKAAAAWSSENGRRYPLSFSIGCATAAEHSLESLKDLLAAADGAMYQDKKRKKHFPLLTGSG
jgi:diguanylate cyclase (GGDEF)-like protein